MAASVEKRSTAFLPTNALIALLAALAAAAVIAILSYRSLISRSDAADAMNHTKQVQQQTEKVLSALRDGETGQRGFLLTGADRYLEPYERGREQLPGLLAVLRQLTSDNPTQQQRLTELEAIAKTKFDELAETLQHERANDHAGALAIVRTDRGKNAMDRARALIEEMESAEQALLVDRTQTWEDSVTSSSYVVFGGVGVLILMIVLIGILASRDYRAVAAEAWVRRVQVALTTEMQGDVRLDSLGEKVLRTLSANLAAPVGAVYAVEGAQLRRIAGIALAPDAATTKKVGEGLGGEAARGGVTVHLDDLPDDYLRVSSALGDGRPSALAIAPAAVDGQVVAVTELAFMRSLDDVEKRALERVSEAIAVAIRGARFGPCSKSCSRRPSARPRSCRPSKRSCGSRTRSSSSRAARCAGAGPAREPAGRARADQQQLEEQTALARGPARAICARTIRRRARARERNTSREFLANMSHELRTPLNSSLILAKLLADNSERQPQPRAGQVREDDLHGGQRPAHA